MTDSPYLLVEGGWAYAEQEGAGGAGALLKDVAVACREGKIVEIGAPGELRRRYRGARSVGGAECLILPGLINAHHHGRGIDPTMLGTPDASLEVWLPSRGGEPLVDPYLDTLWAAAQLLSVGVTTVTHFLLTPPGADVKQHLEARLKAWRDAGIRVALGVDSREQRHLAYEDADSLLASLPAAAAAELAATRPQRGGADIDEYLATFEAVRGEHAGDELAAFFLAPSGPLWTTDESLRRIADYSRENGVPVHTHTLETPYQREAARRIYGRSMVEQLDSLGLLGSHVSLVHGVWLSETDIGTLAESGTNVIHNPGSNLRLASGVAPIPALVAAGVNVAIGTDGLTLGRDDLLAEARLAHQLHRPPGVAAPRFGAADALAAITHRAAATTPFGERIGALRVGAAADLTLVDLAAAGAPYVHEGVSPLEVLLNRADGSHVAATIVAGEVLARNGRPTKLDLSEIAAELTRSVQHRSRGLSGALSEAAAQHYEKRWRRQ